MISDLPLTSITVAHIQQLIDDAVRENRRLDFKLTLDVSDRGERVEFLRDIIAMANADGGTILYGIEEGQGEEKGVAVGCPGVELNRDAISNLIDDVTRNNIEERLTILQHDVRLPSGRYIYIVRVPASPLAPHMIANLKTAPARFYVRANTSNEPMSARQIKEAALRHGSATEKAVERIRRRVDALRQRATTRLNFQNEKAPTNQLILHVVPLFPHAGGWNYADPIVNERIMHVQPFGSWGQNFGEVRFTQHGAFREYSNTSHTGFLRDGTLEGQEYDVIGSDSFKPNEKPVILGSDIIMSVQAAFKVAESLANDGLLPLPVLIQLHLLGVAGSWLMATKAWHSYVGHQPIADADVETEAYVLTDWTERDLILKNLSDHLWQAWGSASCSLFDDEGRLAIINRAGHRM